MLLVGFRQEGYVPKKYLFPFMRGISRSCQRESGIYEVDDALEAEEREERVEEMKSMPKWKGSQGSVSWGEHTVVVTGTTLNSSRSGLLERNDNDNNTLGELWGVHCVWLTFCFCNCCVTCILMIYSTEIYCQLKQIAYRFSRFCHSCPS